MKVFSPSMTSDMPLTTNTWVDCSLVVISRGGPWRGWPATRKNKPMQYKSMRSVATRKNKPMRSVAWLHY